MSKEERRLSILNAAKAVFAERGYSGAGVADIIEKAGVARGTSARSSSTRFANCTWSTDWLLPIQIRGCLVLVAFSPPRLISS